VKVRIRPSEPPQTSKRFLSNLFTSAFESLSGSSVENNNKPNANLNKFSSIVDYRPAHVYKVVADVERYQEFVPWCTKSTIVEHISEKEKLADLTVGFMGISEETFRSHVILNPFVSVTALASSDLYSNSPLKRLKNVWSFEPTGDDRTRVQMELEFEFHNPFYTRLTSHVLKRISNLAMSSFVARCALIKDDLVQEDIHKTEQAILADDSFRGVPDSFKSLASCAHLEEIEVEFLAHEFERLTHDSCGRLSREALRKWLGRPEEDVVNYVFDRMDVDKNGTLTLREFIRGVSLIARGTLEEKRYTWFGNRRSETITREELERTTLASLIVREALQMTVSPSSVPPSVFEKPEMAARRMVAPVFRDGLINIRALERLLATM